MKGSEVKQMVYNKLVNLNFSRKENYLKDANSTNWDTLGDELKEVILMFPSRFVDYDNDLMDIEDLSGEQQFYLFHSKGNTYLVDTQGYNYPRYTTLLEGFDDGVDYDDDKYERMEGLLRISDDMIIEHAIKSIVLDFGKEGFDSEDVETFLQMRIEFLIKKGIASAQHMNLFV
jgi:hypothetical protein